MIAAMNWVAQNAQQYNIRVVNMSLGAGVFESYTADPLTLAAKRAVDAGIVVVAAAGNMGKAADGQPLPSVRLAFAGPVAQFSSLTPQLDADQFERYLSIKRIDRDMDKLEKLNEQRNNPRNAPARPVAKTGPGPSEQRAAPAPSAGGPGEPAPPVPQGPPNESIPTQSLLRAPPVILEPPTEQRQVNTPAPAPPPAAAAPPTPAAPSGWSTGTETTTAPAANPAPADARRTQAEPLPSESPTDFETRIREVLRAQEQNARQ